MTEIDPAVEEKLTEILSPHIKDAIDASKNEIFEKINKDTKIKTLMDEARPFYDELASDESLKNNFRDDFQYLDEFFAKPDDESNFKVVKNITNRFKNLTSQAKKQQENTFVDKSSSQIGSHIPSSASVTLDDGNFPESSREIDSISEEVGKNELKKQWPYAIDHRWAQGHGTAILLTKNEEIDKLGNLLGKVTRLHDGSRKFVKDTCGGLLSKEEKRSYADAFDYSDKSYTFGYNSNEAPKEYLLSRQIANIPRKIDDLTTMVDPHYINAILKIREASKELDAKENIGYMLMKYKSKVLI